jgi:hypothetical protein
MKPKPLESLNHLTVPVLICKFPKKNCKKAFARSAGTSRGEKSDDLMR